MWYPWLVLCFFLSGSLYFFLLCFCSLFSLSRGQVQVGSFFVLLVSLRSRVVEDADPYKQNHTAHTTPLLRFFLQFPFSVYALYCDLYFSTSLFCIIKSTKVSFPLNFLFIRTILRLLYFLFKVLTFRFLMIILFYTFSIF